MALLSLIRNRFRSLLRSRPRTESPPAAIYTVRSDPELEATAALLSRRGAGGTFTVHRRLNELRRLGSSGLLVHVAVGAQPCRLVLEPWDRRHVTFSGGGWTIMAGADANAVTPVSEYDQLLHTRSPYELVPPQPVFVVSMRHAGETELRGFFPPHVSHVTILGGATVVYTQRLRHDRGPQIFHLAGRAA